MPQYQHLSLMLESWDMPATLTFYTDVLGFDLAGKDSDDDENMHWMDLEKDRVQIMFRTPNEHLGYNEPQFSGNLYIYTDDVDGLWQRVKDHARIVYPIEDFDYGMREFAIYDNNGYILSFGKAIDSE